MRQETEDRQVRPVHPMARHRGTPARRFVQRGLRAPDHGGDAEPQHPRPRLLELRAPVLARADPQRFAQRVLERRVLRRAHAEFAMVAAELGEGLGDLPGAVQVLDQIPERPRQMLLLERHRGGEERPQ
ncbi:hypothetical protein GCM10027073_35760 [Streptomyces chlorus]